MKKGMFFGNDDDCSNEVANSFFESLENWNDGNNYLKKKLVYLFESYFKMGGTHFQLTYVSKEDLINAKKTPDKYKNVRVRVSGFSDYFVFLNEGLQDEIIQRTSHTK